MKLKSITQSEKPDKKLKAIFITDDNRTKTTHFGAAKMMDYTLYYKEEGKEKADIRKQLYRTRHKKDLETKDPTRAGYLAHYILWNLPTIEASIADYKRRFNL